MRRWAALLLLAAACAAAGPSLAAMRHALAQADPERRARSACTANETASAK